MPKIEIEPKNGLIFLHSKITLLSLGDIPGKTCFLNRIKGIAFSSESPQTIFNDKIELPFVNNNLKYKLLFWDTSWNERYRSIALSMVKSSNMVIYFFDLSREYNGISLDFITMIREETRINNIYIVGNKY